MKTHAIGLEPSGVPLYKAVKQKILDAVHYAEWKPGETIPSEKKLSKMYAVSIGTVRKAVDELSGEGVLIRQQGRGTFVATHDENRYLFTFFHIVRHDGHKEYPQVDLLEFSEIKANSSIAEELRVDLRSNLFRFVNLLKLNKLPVLMDEIFIPKQRFLGFSKQGLTERPSSIYQYYQKTFGVTVMYTRERVRAVSADIFVANILGVNVGTPVLKIIRVAFSFKEQPVELRYSYVLTKDYEYSSDLIDNT